MSNFSSFNFTIPLMVRNQICLCLEFETGIPFFHEKYQYFLVRKKKKMIVINTICGSFVSQSSREEHF